MGRKQIHIRTADDLLILLNEVADLVIGNELPEDVGFNERTTLPELLSYAMMKPNDKKVLKQALDKMDILSAKVDHIKALLHRGIVKIDLKNKMFSILIITFVKILI